MIDDKKLLDCFDRLYLKAIERGIEDLGIPAVKFLDTLNLVIEPEKFNRYYKLNKEVYLLFGLIDVKLKDGKFDVKFNEYKKYDSSLKYHGNNLKKRLRHDSRKVKPIDRNKEGECRLYAKCQ